MEDLVKRFGGILREQQKGVAMEWRKANGNNSKLLVWERENSKTSTVVSRSAATHGENFWIGGRI